MKKSNKKSIGKVYKKVFKSSRRAYKRCKEIDDENFWLYVDVGLIVYMKVIGHSWGNRGKGLGDAV